MQESDESTVVTEDDLNRARARFLRASADVLDKQVELNETSRRLEVMRTEGLVTADEITALVDQLEEREVAFAGAKVAEAIAHAAFHLVEDRLAEAQGVHGHFGVVVVLRDELGQMLTLGDQLAAAATGRSSESSGLAVDPSFVLAALLAQRGRSRPVRTWEDLRTEGGNDLRG